jgi:nucleoside-diphosphate-sugar epimerase
MNILITGGLGYVGSVLTEKMQDSNSKLIGIDPFWFASSALTSYVNDYEELHIKQISDLSDAELKKLLINIDCVIALAAVSNDPMGNIFEKITHEVNFNQNVRLYKLAKSIGVKKFIFASSCSVYGSGSEGLSTENTPTNPLTAYSKSKVEFEDFLSKQSDNIIKISLRFATAAGASNCPRTDLAVNDFVYTGISEGKIKLNSSGTSNRPFISVHDMCEAIQNFVLDKSILNSDHKIFNVGTNKNNYKILDVASLVARSIGCEVEFESTSEDTRNYKVSFERYNKMFPNHVFQSLDEIVHMLVQQYKNIIKDSRPKSDFVRLITLKEILHK